jgi:hypothetical protein
MDGKHSAGMQPEGAGAFFLPGEVSLRDATLPRFFFGSVTGRNEAIRDPARTQNASRYRRRNTDATRGAGLLRRCVPRDDDVIFRLFI